MSLGEAKWVYLVIGFKNEICEKISTFTNVRLKDFHKQKMPRGVV